MGNGKLGLCTMLQHVQPLTPTAQIDKREDPYAPQQQSGCCTVM
jgi:hypothetical protein